MLARAQHERNELFVFLFRKKKKKKKNKLSIIFNFQKERNATIDTSMNWIESRTENAHSEVPIE